MKRTFIAIEVRAGKRLMDTITLLRSEMRNDIIRWVDPGHLHITLAFLGDTGEKLIREVITMLETGLAGTEEFSFPVHGLGIFRNISDPRVIWAGIRSADELEDLHNRIKKGLGELGMKTEDRRFMPHLTLGRIKQIRNPEILETLLEQYRDTPFQTTDVREVIFFESILKPSGPEYVQLFAATLHGKTLN
jgi:2'-5' RNA ligase